MLAIKVEDSQVQEVHDAVNDALAVDPILDQGAAILLARIRQRFLAEVDPDGRPWIPSYASIVRKKIGRGGGTLFDTGRLFHSIQLFDPTGDSRTIGTDVPYATDHQYGLAPMQASSSGRRFMNGLPARPFLGINDGDVDLVTNYIISRVEDAIKGFQ